MKKRIFFVLFLLLGSLASEAQSRIIAGEYFWGTMDPGSGNGTAFTATDGTFSDVIESLVATGQTIPNMTSPIRFNVRVKDISNNWGPTFKKVIFLTTNLPTTNEVKVSQGEYFFGSSDPGQGNGTQLVVFDGNWNEAIESATALNATWSLSSGLHLFNIRAKDGNNLWGPLFKKTISVQSPSANPRLCKIQTGEFFFGVTDPGQGSGTTLLVLDGNWSDAVETALNSNVTWSLSNGMTLFNVRVKDESNNWGPVFKKTLSVQSPPTFRLVKVTAGEFYFGTFDPGQGTGTTILAFDGEYNDALEQAFSQGYAWNFSGASTLFNIRFKDESNQWGPVYKKTVFRDELPTARGLNITFAEYYFGVFDPGAGTGNVIVAFDGNFDSAMEILLRNHLTWENQSGSTLFNIRVKDETNKWGPVFKRTIFFNGANPAVNLITQGETISRCPTFPVTLSYAGPLGFNVTWENGATGNEVTFVPDASGYFTVMANLGNEYLYDSIYVNVYALPPANITPAGDILVCASSNVMLTANSGTNYSYVWYYNDAVIPGETMINYLPTQVGAYKVRVTDNTTTCQQTSSPTTFYLTSPIFPTGTVTTACNPNGVLLTGPVGSGNTYQWKKNGAAISGATSGTYLATTAGNYQVTVTNGQCVSTSSTTTVTTTGSTVVSTITPSGTQSICEGGSVVLTASTGSGYTYQWNKDGVAIAGATSGTYTATTSGAYTVTVTATGCSLTSSATTVVLGTPVTPSVSISANNTTVCSGTAVLFTATPTNGGTTPTYQWKKNGVDIAGATTATYTLSTPVNGDVISVVMVSNNSCQSTNISNSNSITLVVNPSVTPTVSITSSGNTICAGASVQFTSSIINGGTTPTYQWKKNGVNISGATSATYSNSALVNGDVITLQMISNATCASASTVLSNAITMIVSTAVTPSVSIVADATTVCANTAVNFTATPTNGGTTPTYQWKKNGVNITGATSTTYTLTSPTNNDAISVVITSNANCTSTTVANSNSVTITVTSGLTPSVSIAADATSICSGTTVNFTSTPTNGGTTPTYQWKKNGVNISGATSATYALTSPMNGDIISLVMTSNAGCTSTPTATSNSVTLAVTSLVTPTVAISASGTTVCSGTSVQFTSSITNGGSSPLYQWKKNGVNISGATASTYTSNALVTGDVITLQLTSNAICPSSTVVASNAVTMTVTATVTPTVSIAADASTVCANTAVNFTANPTNGGTTPTYQWKKNGVNITGATSSTYTLSTPANGDVITVVMTSNATCASTTTATSNSVALVVTANVTYYADADGDGYGNPQSTLSACTQTAGYVTSNTDCNDNSAQVNPGAAEVCNNGIDDNCNAQIDENCIVLGCTNATACNFNPDANTDDGSCVLPVAEICNGLDDNCNNQVDEGLTFVDYYVDQDQDGYGTTLFGNFCQAPVGSYATLSGDCNDANNTIAPNLSETCNTIDDNCNGLIDEGVTVASVVSTLVSTKLYPTCSGTNLFSANMNLGYNSPVTVGDGNDLWFKLIPTYNTLRAGLSAATGDNQLELYSAEGNCLTLITTEHEVGVSNQTLFTDDLIPGNTYYVVCRNMSGAMNTSAKICFNHFDGSTCDHYYSNNTGIYTNVCTAFKAVYKGNASNYVFNVNSASIGGVNQNITPWSYTTPTSSSIITRLGTLVPVNMGASPITYGLTVGVTYVLADAAGNLNYFMANGTSPCTLTLNPETTIALRSTDRCPTLKSVTSSIAPDRSVCGALRYEWEFTQVLPSAQQAVTVLGGLNSNVLFLNNVPGMGNGKTYNVRVRPLHSSGAIGEWGTTQCLKTASSGMIQEDNDQPNTHWISKESKMSIYPNPSADGILNLVWNQEIEGLQDLRLFDVTGKLIIQRQINVSGSQVQIELPALSNGVYMIQVNDTRLPWVIAR